MKSKNRWKGVKNSRKRKRKARRKPQIPKPQPKPERPQFTDWWYSGRKSRKGI